MQPPPQILLLGPGNCIVRSHPVAVAPSPPQYPGACDKDPDPSGEPHGPGNFGIVLQQTPARKDRVPIMVAASNQRQLQPPSIRHIAGDIEPILEEPDQGSRQAEALACAPATYRQNQRKYELPKRATVGLQPCTE